MNIFALDSNIVSFYIRQRQQIIQKVHNELAAGNEVLITPIAYYEVKRGLMAISAQTHLKNFSLLCETLGVGQLNNAILDSAAEVYLELKIKKMLIEDADILTAAFCRTHGFILVTNNTRHFENISNLRLCDWV